MGAPTLVCVLLGLSSSAWGQFQLSFGTDAPQIPPGQYNPNCADKLDNCEAYGAASCSGQYESWAKNNCALTCKFCTGPATMPPPCVDKLDNCASYEGSSCTSSDYHAWALENCRKTCRFCTAAQLANIDSHVTTIPPSQCVDKLDCRLYGQSSCSGTYEKWARTQCMNFCGFCKGIEVNKPCVDSRPNCDQYGKTMCTDPKYSVWVEDNCAKFCGKCSGGGSGSGPIFLTPPPLSGGSGGGMLTPPPPGRK